MKHLHWYAHRKGCCTNGAGGSVQGYIGAHTETGTVQMEQAEMYRVTLVRTQKGVPYKRSRQKCTGYIGTHTQKDDVQMEQAEVYRVTFVRTHKGVLYKWSRQKSTGLVHGHGKRRTEKERTRRMVKSRASPRDCFLFFRLDKVKVPYKSGSKSCEKCPLTCKDGLCGKILMLCL